MTDSGKTERDGAVGRLKKDTRGATAIEYALLVAGIFLAVLAAVNFYVDRVNLMYNNISENVVQ